MIIYFIFFTSFFVIIGTLILTIFIFFTMFSIVPFRMDKKWEKDSIPTDSFLDYLYFSSVNIAILCFFIFIGIIFEYLKISGYFFNSVNTFWIPITSYGIYFITALSASAVIGIVSYFRLPGMVCYVITIISSIFTYLLIL